MFKTLNIHSQVLTGTYPHTWDCLITEHISFYHDLVQSDDYPSALGGKEDSDDSIQALVAQAIDQRLEQLHGGAGGGSQGGSPTKHRCLIFVLMTISSMIVLRRERRIGIISCLVKMILAKR